MGNPPCHRHESDIREVCGELDSITSSSTTFFEQYRLRDDTCSHISCENESNYAQRQRGEKRRCNETVIWIESRLSDAKPSINPFTTILHANSRNEGMQGEIKAGKKWVCSRTRGLII